MFWDKNLRNAKKAEKKMEKRVKERSWMTRSARRVKTSLFSATACCSD